MTTGLYYKELQILSDWILKTTHPVYDFFPSKTYGVIDKSLFYESFDISEEKIVEIRSEII